MQPLLDDVALLRTTPLFEGLVFEDQQSLAADLRKHVVKAGQMIFAQGDAGDAMYLIASGDVNIFLPGDSSRRVSLKDLQAGEYFGELAIFDDKPRSASALATTDTVLLALSRERLVGYLETRPRAAVAIMRTLAQRLRETNALLSERVAKNAVREVEAGLSWGDRVADRVAELNGSWKFICVLLMVTGGWVACNSWRWGKGPFDPYPYVFFNLLLAVLVALQGPLIVMSQNRQTLKDRAQADTDYRVNLKNEVNIETILRELAEFRTETHQRRASVGRMNDPIE